MVDMQLETVMPDPSATSLANDETAAAKSGETTELDGSGVVPTENNGMSEVGPSIDEVKDVMEDIKSEDQLAISHDEVSVEIKGHEVSANGAVPELPKATSPEASNDTKDGKPTNGRRNSGHQTRGRDRKYGNKSDRPFKNYRENVKSDLTSQEESSDPVAIRKQVD